VAVRTTQVWGPIAVPVTPASVSFTAPADRVVIVRSMTLTYSGVLQAADVRLALTPEGGGAPIEFWRATVQAGLSASVPYFVIDPGNTLVASLGSAPPSGTVRVAAFGSVLSGPPV
jgi:hypothetical protein